MGVVLCLARHLESLERGVSVLRTNFKTVLATILVASLFLLAAVCLTVGGLFTISVVATFVATASPIGRVAKLGPAQVLRE